MKETDIKVIKFLVSGKAYSDTAIIKNTGITFEELQNSYNRLIEEGYLEEYTDYLARTNNSFKSNETECSGGCGSCEGENSCLGCANSVPEEDYKNIKVVTEKAIREFE